MDKKTAIKARRAHIVNAALACFLEKGYNQTGIRDIAKRAEISLGNLYNHFPSKKAVLIEIASMEEEEVEELVALLSDYRNPEKTLRRFLKVFTEACQDPDYVMLFLEIIGEAVRDKEISDLFVAGHEKLVDALAGLLIAGQKAGKFHEQNDYREIAEIILDSVEGYGARAVLGMKVPRSGGKVLHEFLLKSIVI